MRSITCLAFRGVIRICLTVALTSMSFLTPHRGYGFFGAVAFSAEALEPPWPLNILVGENSPTLWPTIFSVIYTGMNFFPLWTARVCPTNSGMIVDLRDHVLRIFLSPATFIDSIFFIRLSSIKGPFFTDLGTAPSAASHSKLEILNHATPLQFAFFNFQFSIRHSENVVYLLFVLREMIYLRVALFRRVFFPSGSPHGEHPGRPPEDLPSPPPSG